MKLRIRTLLLAVLTIAAVLGALRGFWESGKTNHHLLLGAVSGGCFRVRRRLDSP